MVQHCSANAEAMSSNPVEVPVSFFFFFYLQLLKLQLPCTATRRSYIYLKFVFLQFTSSSNKKRNKVWMRRREYNRICLSKFEDLSAQKLCEKKKKTMLSIKRMKMTILYIIYLSHPCVTRMCYFDAICDPVSWYQRIFHTTGSLKNNLNKQDY